MAMRQTWWPENPYPIEGPSLNKMRHDAYERACSDMVDALTAEVTMDITDMANIKLKMEGSKFKPEVGGGRIVLVPEIPDIKAMGK